MQTTELSVHLKKDDIEQLIMRYHFRTDDIVLLQSLSQAMQPLLRVKAYYVWQKQDSSIAYEDYAIVFLTLGEGIDRLQELYMDQKCLSEAYMIDCIALEYLTKAYEEFVRYIQKETGKWAVKIDFLGDTYPVTMLPKLIQKFDDMKIGYNEKYVLTPSKSVAFLLPMSKARTKNPCHICDNCSNTECLFRKDSRGRKEEKGRKEGQPVIPNTYGYQRIFGQSARKSRKDQ